MVNRASPFSRGTGVQLHPTSLPSGRLGEEAFAFVDWLAEAGQSWWQMLPLGPPDEHRSPYKSASAFAAWPGLLADPSAPVSAREVAGFRARHAYWAEEWAEHSGDDAIEDQVRFEREWAALRAHAAARGVRLLGDVPIYVAPGSAEHLAWPELFRSGEVAGAAPDKYSEHGQHWGNPLFDWPALQRTGYRFWIERLRRAFELFDAVRIDHFRGFVAYWAIPDGTRDAAEGRWRRGPGRAVFEAARRELGTLPVVAENLGLITPPVERLRRELGFPGMVVLQFAFDPKDRRNPHRPEAHTEDTIVYGATHDNDTTLGWWRNSPDRVQALVQDALARNGIDEGDDVAWAFVRLALSSPSVVAMHQAQDLLGLGSEARMNVPGREGGNWGWRLEPGALDAALARRLHSASDAAGRVR